MTFLYVLLGILSGFFSSTPLGPINLWVANHRLSKSPVIQLFYFLLAVILVDIAFAAIAFWGQFEILEDSTEIKWAGIISGSFTSIVGMILLYKARSEITVKSSEHGQWSAFLQGITLTASNPAFLLFWLFVANQIMLRLDTSFTLPELAAFSFGIMLGDILWFLTFNWILHHLEKKSQDSTLKKIRIAVSIALIIVGLTGLSSYVLK
jgi:threonine/homoserine/homoserine lactone efflux protein